MEQVGNKQFGYLTKTIIFSMATRVLHNLLCSLQSNLFPLLNIVLCIKCQTIFIDFEHEILFQLNGFIILITMHWSGSWFMVDFIFNIWEVEALIC